jgi:tetratricopeptide (TPR) repeat protein
MLARTLIVFLLFSCSLKADQNDARLEDLFDILSTTESDVQINEVTSNIWDIWYETNDPSIEADFYGGLESMRTGDLMMAVVFFTRVIDKNPNFAEGWNKRATVYYMLGKFDASMMDIHETLKLEPRHFGAMDGMGLIFIHLEQFDKAIDIYDQMLKIFPNNSSTKQKKEMLINRSSESA